MKPYRLIPLVLLAFTFAGCVSAPGPNCARLSMRGFFCLLPPSALPPTQSTDLVTVTQNGQNRRYVGQLSVDSRCLELVLMNLAGVPAATLVWDGHDAAIRAPKKTKLDPQRLVALLELTLARPAVLRPALHGLTLSASPGSGERRLSDGHVLIARSLAAPGGVTHITVPTLRLAITLEPLSYDGK